MTILVAQLINAQHLRVAQSIKKQSVDSNVSESTIYSILALSVIRT